VNTHQTLLAWSTGIVGLPTRKHGTDTHAFILRETFVSSALPARKVRHRQSVIHACTCQASAKRGGAKSKKFELTEEQKQEIREAFDLFDTDGSGQLLFSAVVALVGVVLPPLLVLLITPPTGFCWEETNTPHAACVLRAREEPFRAREEPSTPKIFYLARGRVLSTPSKIHQLSSRGLLFPT